MCAWNACNTRFLAPSVFVSLFLSQYVTTQTQQPYYNCPRASLHPVRYELQVSNSKTYISQGFHIYFHLREMFEYLQILLWTQIRILPGFRCEINEFVEVVLLITTILWKTLRVKVHLNFKVFDVSIWRILKSSLQLYGVLKFWRWEANVNTWIQHISAFKRFLNFYYI